MTEPAAVICGIRSVQVDADTALAAAELARRLGLALELVHVRLPPPVLVGSAGVVLPPTDATGRLLTADATSLADLAALGAELGGGGLTVRTTLLDGPLTGVLQGLGRQRQTAWLVLGDGGRGPLAAALGGGATRRLLPDAGCPLLVVPREHQPLMPDDALPVACLVDDDALAPAVCALAADLAAALQTTVLIVHAVDGTVRDAERKPAPPALLERCRHVVEERLVACRTQLAAGDRIDALLATSRAAGARMLVIGGSTHGALAAPVTHATAHRLIAAAHEPVAVVRDGDGR